MFLSNLIQSWPCTFQCIMKKVFFLLFFKGYIDHLFDNLVSGKKLLFWKKVWKKSVRTLYDTFSHDTIRPCNFAFIRLRNFEAKLFPSFLLLSSISNLCLFEEVPFTGFESQDVTCLLMIAQVSTLDFQQTYNITVDLRLLSRMGWFFAQAHLFRLLRKNEEFLEVLHVYCCVSSIPVRTHLKFVLLGLQDWLQLQKRWHLQETRREGV